MPSRRPVVGSHPSSVLASVMSGQRRVGSSVGSGSKTIPDVDPVTSRTKCARSRHGALVGVADVDGAGERGVEQGQQAPDLVVDEAQAPGLAAVPVDGQGLAPQGLHDEVGHDPAVARREPGAVGVEDPGDAHVHPVGAVHGHGQALGEPLGLVVDAARAGRVDVAPVALDLGVHLGVPVDLAGARHEEAGAVRPGQLEQAPRALAARPPACRRAGRGTPAARRARPGCRRRRPVRSPPSSTLSLTLVTMRLKRSWPSRCATLSFEPVERSSRQTTVSPRSSSRSHRCDPRNPAPPATTTRLTGARSPRSGSPCAAPRRGRAGCGRRRCRARP